MARDYNAISDEKLQKMSMDDLNALALELLEDRPRRFWRRLQAERTRRFRLEELRRGNLAKQVSGLSDEELAALRQDVAVEHIDARTKAHTPGTVE